MRHRILARLVLALGAVGVTFLATPAQAGGPTRITVTGPGLSQPVVIGHDSTTAFSDWSNVIHQAGLEIGSRRVPLVEGPTAPGPRYRMVVDYHDIPTYRYELYPHASGGPHIYVPAAQPRAEMPLPGAVGWYLSDGRMVELLRDVGASSITATAAASPVTPEPVASLAGRELVLLGVATAGSLCVVLLVIWRRRVTA